MGAEPPAAAVSASRIHHKGAKITKNVVSAEGVSDPEAAYFQTIEEFFVCRRGDPLFLSNADWLLIRKWRAGGVPLRVVLRGISDALDAHAHSWSRDRKVGSLAYCAAEVDVARERWERALSLGAQEGLDVAGVLRGFAEALDGARGVGASARAAARALAVELRERAVEPGDMRPIEEWLAAAEGRLLEALRHDDGTDAVARLQAHVDTELAPYRGRMPARVLAQIRAESLARRLLESHGLPRLSFFHL